MSTTTTNIQHMPCPESVLANSIGTAGKRQRRPGTYHVSDLIGKTVQACAALYAGTAQEDPFPAYLAKRGLALEALALESLPAEYRQCEVSWPVTATCTIVGHPDGLVPYLSEGHARILPLEVASQLDAEDLNKEAVKLDQLLSYAGMINNGASVTTPAGVPIPGMVEEVRVLLMGLWASQEIPYTRIAEAAAERADWLAAKAVLVDGLTRHPESDEARLAAARWDRRHPHEAFTPEVIPPADDELEAAVREWRFREDEAAAATKRAAEWKDKIKVWFEEHPDTPKLQLSNGKLNWQRGSSPSFDKERLAADLAAHGRSLDDYKTSTEWFTPRWYPAKSAQ